MRQIPLPIAPAPAERFDTLAVGANAQAVAHLQGLVDAAKSAAVAGAAGVAAPPAPPLYLWGPSGSGKTRLLRALAAEMQALGQPVARFGPASPLPWVLAPDDRLVLLDDAEQLDAAHQQAAFALFVEAGSQGAQWVAAGRWPPVDLPLRDDLRSRLGWGLVFAIAPLAEPEAREALRREAARRGIRLGDEVLGYLLTRFDRNLAHLMALLDRLDDYALSEHRPVTVPLLKKMLQEAPLGEAAAPAHAPSAQPTAAAAGATPSNPHPA